MAVSGSDTEMLPLRAAMEAGDLAGAVAAFAPDAVLRSPLTDRVAFRGRHEIEEIVGVILERFEGLTYTDELRTGDRAVLVASARVAGVPIEFVDHIRLDGDGLVREMTVFFRTFPSSAVALRVLGTELARRRHGEGRARAVSALTMPTVAVTAMGDRLGSRLV